MNRRDTLKSIILGSVATGLALNGCSPGASSSDELPTPNKTPLYGRTESETLRDRKLFEATFFSEHEFLTIAVLCDIILPKSNEFNSATDADTVGFIAFIAKKISDSIKIA